MNPAYDTTADAPPTKPVDGRGGARKGSGPKGRVTHDGRRYDTIKTIRVYPGKTDEVKALVENFNAQCEAQEPQNED